MLLSQFFHILYRPASHTFHIILPNTVPHNEKAIETSEPKSVSALDKEASIAWSQAISGTKSVVNHCKVLLNLDRFQKSLLTSNNVFQLFTILPVLATSLNHSK
jgi:hypothetical protein